MRGDISVVRYTDEMKDMWNDFCETAKNSLFMFDRNYMDYHKERFKDHSLMFYKDDALVSIFPANEKERVLYSHGGLTHGGFLINSKAKQHIINSCFDALVENARTEGFLKIYYKTIPHIYHEQPAEEDKYALYKHNARLIEVSASTVINLRDPAKMPKGRRAQISRARREGIIIQELTEKKDFDFFIRLENEILESRHNTHTVHSADELYLLYTRFPNQIHLYGAMLDNKMIAGLVLYEYRQVVHTQYMAADNLARTIGALDMAIAFVIDKYKNSKLWMDFGISTEDGGRYLNEGLISQKEGFGGRTNVYEMWEITI